MINVRLQLLFQMFELLSFYWCNLGVKACESGYHLNVLWKCFEIIVLCYLIVKLYEVLELFTKKWDCWMSDIMGKVLLYIILIQLLLRFNTLKNNNWCITLQIILFQLNAVNNHSFHILKLKIWFQNNIYSALIYLRLNLLALNW